MPNGGFSLIEELIEKISFMKNLKKKKEKNSILIAFLYLNTFRKIMPNMGSSLIGDSVGKIPFMKNLKNKSHY